MSSDFNGDFAKLVPRNQHAQRLFSKTYAYVVEQNSTFHLSFMRQQEDDKPSTPNAKSEEPVESSTDYDTNPDTDAEEHYNESQRSQLPRGHFVLSLSEGKGPEAPHLGWRAGRGSSKFAHRNVDLLLAKPKAGLSRSLASVHMLFQLNARSGFLTLASASKKVLAEYYSAGDGRWRAVDYLDKQLLYQACTLVRAGECEYELTYTIAAEQRAAYLAQRNLYIQEVLESDVKFHPPLKAVPGDAVSVIRGQRYVEFETRGRGTFGWINQGVDTKTGDLVAIKELRISGGRVRKEVQREVDIGRRLSNMRGLIPLLETLCEHGHADSCSDLERYHMIFPYAVADFTLPFWHSADISTGAKLSLLREPLEGLHHLHALGIMHRDVRPANTLILSIKPPRAAICDYGKAIEAEHSAVTTIGPVHTLAPEVWTASSSIPYTHKIDLWAYGYALAEILGYSVRKYPGPKGFDGDNNPRLTRDRHARIIRMLLDYAAKSPEHRLIVDLASKLLVWAPAARLSAAEALEHECWNLIPQRNRPGTEDTDEDIEASGPRKVLRQT